MSLIEGIYKETPLVAQGMPSWASGMIKSKIALGDAFGNASAKRMVSPNPNTGMTPERMGTHYMGSYGNLAIPHLQDTGKKELEYFDKQPPLIEGIRFDRDVDADIFSEYYKLFAPMMKMLDKL